MKQATEGEREVFDSNNIDNRYDLWFLLEKFFNIKGMLKDSINVIILISPWLTLYD